MKRYRVSISPAVIEQVRELADFIAQDSIPNAVAWESRLQVKFHEIGEMAGSHMVDEDASERFGSKVHRSVFEGTYLIHYTVNDEMGVVDIVNLRHGARMPRGNEP